jgi:hypothetical protein
MFTQIMNILMSRFPYGSEMSGSGAAQDPLFWVAHGTFTSIPCLRSLLMPILRFFGAAYAKSHIFGHDLGHSVPRH